MSLLLILLFIFLPVAWGGVDLWAQTLVYSLLGLSVLLLLKRFIGNNSPLQINRQSLLFILLLGLLFGVNQIHSLSFAKSFPAFLLFISYLIFFFLSQQLSSSEERFVLNAVYLNGLFLAGLSLGQYLHKQSPASTLLNPNILAGYLTLSLFLGGSTRLFLPLSDKVERLIRLVGCGFILAILLFVLNSTAARLGLICGVAVLLLGLKDKLPVVRLVLQKKRWQLWSGLSFFLLGAFLIINRLSYPGVIERYLWLRSAVSLFKEHPWLGWGGDHFSAAYLTSRSPGLLSLYVHNYYLQFLVEYGFLVALVSGFFIIWLIWRSPNPFLRASLISLLIFNLFDYNLFVPAVAYLFWFLLGRGIKTKAWFLPAYSRTERSLIFIFLGLLTLGVYLKAILPFRASRQISRAEYFLEQGNYSLADYHLQKAESLAYPEPDAAVLRGRLAFILYQENKEKSHLLEAINALQSAVNLDRLKAKNWLMLGKFLLENGEKRAGLKALQQALKVDPYSEKLRKILKDTGYRPQDRKSTVNSPQTREIGRQKSEDRKEGCKLQASGYKPQAA